MTHAISFSAFSLCRSFWMSSRNHGCRGVSHEGTRKDGRDDGQNCAKQQLPGPSFTAVLASSFRNDHKPCDEKCRHLWLIGSQPNHLWTYGRSDQIRFQRNDISMANSKRFTAKPWTLQNWFQCQIQISALQCRDQLVYPRKGGMVHVCAWTIETKKINLQWHGWPWRLTPTCTCRHVRTVPPNPSNSRESNLIQFLHYLPLPNPIPALNTLIDGYEPKAWHPGDHQNKQK